MQAARGTALSQHDDSSLADTTVPSGAARARVLLVIAFAVPYAADQVTKWLAVDRLASEADRDWWATSWSCT